MTTYDIIKKPVISQKAYQVTSLKQIVFKVDMRANAPLIKKAVEEIFSVRVVRVNTHIKKGKSRRIKRVLYSGSIEKYAYVTLAKGYEINFFEQQVGSSEGQNASSNIE